MEQVAETHFRRPLQLRTTAFAGEELPSKTDRRQSAWHMFSCEDDKKCIRRLARDNAGDILHIGDIGNLKVISCEVRRTHSATSLSITIKGNSGWVLERWRNECLGQGIRLRFWSLPH